MREEKEKAKEKRKENAVHLVTNNDITVQVYRLPVVLQKPMGERCGFVPVPILVWVSWVQVWVGPHQPVPYLCATLIINALSTF